MLDFDLVVFVKETQLQHGLRGEDYTRYRRYVTNRVATLRGQLGLGNDKKKYLGKEVTPQNAVDPRHLMLLVLYAERCWAAAEETLARRDSKRDAGELRSSGGVPPKDTRRKKLNKAVKWTARLVEVAAAVASERLQRQCGAYDEEIRGACAATHRQYAEAKRHFLAARAAYVGLYGGSTGQQSALLATKVTEMDDRVVFCMQRLGEDLSAYRPQRLQDAGDQLAGVGALAWNGRELRVTSIKVKEALRDALAVPVEEAQERLLEQAGLLAVGQCNKVLELMDRRINCFNDGLAHARQDLRGAPDGAQRTELQLIVHYLLFQVAYESMRRTLFLTDVHSRRLEATERALQQRAAGGGGKKAEIAASQFASPQELVRLFSAAAAAVEEMELLPGVAGRADVEELSALCRAGKLFYLGEAWRVLDEGGAALDCYSGALTLLKGCALPRARELHQQAERASLRLLAAGALPPRPPAEPIAVLSDVPGSSAAVGVAEKVCHFPPDFQAAPLKPAFVDIASTFIEFPSFGAAAAAGAGGGQKSKPAAGTAAGEGKEKKGWGWKLWGNSGSK